MNKEGVGYSLKMNCGQNWRGVFATISKLKMGIVSLPLNGFLLINTFVVTYFLKIVCFLLNFCCFWLLLVQERYSIRFAIGRSRVQILAFLGPFFENSILSVALMWWLHIMSKIWESFLQWPLSVLNGKRTTSRWFYLKKWFKNRYCNKNSLKLLFHLR